MSDNITDIIQNYSDENSERNQKALQEIKRTNLEAALLALQVTEKEQYLELRKQWSKHIAKGFWIILISGILFIALVGQGYLEYSSYPNFPAIVLGTFFLDIIGLALVVAKFLFPKYR